MSELMEVQDFNPLQAIIEQQSDAIRTLEEENENLTEEISNLTTRIEELENELEEANTDREDRDHVLNQINKLVGQYV